MKAQLQRVLHHHFHEHKKGEIDLSKVNFFTQRCNYSRVAYLIVSTWQPAQNCEFWGFFCWASSCNFIAFCYSYFLAAAAALICSLVQQLTNLMLADAHNNAFWTEWKKWDHNRTLSWKGEQKMSGVRYEIYILQMLLGRFPRNRVRFPNSYKTAGPFFAYTFFPR